LKEKGVDVEERVRWVVEEVAVQQSCPRRASEVVLTFEVRDDPRKLLFEASKGRLQVFVGRVAEA
jgi:hypothetical protein